ncbi:MAG: glycosyl hydrolase family 2 [Prevotella sp.]|nr:glycosyl hydrolase family 2 [Prevotella sp.]
MKNKIDMAFMMLTLTLLTGCKSASDGMAGLGWGFDHPQDSARTKVWWFLGETPTTPEGITADLEAFRRKGVGGVVYYDQVHGSGAGADSVFSTPWWQHLELAATEARRLGLSFEANIGNGYVAGGRWITPECSMQRLAATEVLMTAPGSIRLPLPRRPQGWHRDVAVLAIPYRAELLGDSRLMQVTPERRADSILTFDFGQTFTARSITYEAKPQGKARTSSMQVPPTHTPLAQADPTRFYGCGFRELPAVGVLEVSDDDIIYNKVCDLRPKYQNLGGLRQQTVAFPAVSGRYFRITAAKGILGEVVVSARACVDEWEEKASLVSEFMTADSTPRYDPRECINADSIVDLTGRMRPDGTLDWPDAPAGQWLIMRFVALTTGGHTKHGRAEALGLECDKLSVEGARLHWQSYTQPLIDSVRAHGGRLEGICMDSHEAGPQNWTATMEIDFSSLRGYDMRRFLPTMAAGLYTPGATAFLKDLRRTISDLITDRYYGEFNRLCREQGLTLTAQAIGGALCLAGDNIEVKKLVDKPQGEFWGYQTEGNYDIKDCSSAAHVYGKPIASGEAFTDITYKHSLADVKNLADYAYCFGINEFVVCAVAYQPDTAGHLLSTANGRQYVLNRLNTQWPMSRDFWDYQARCSWMLRQGRPVSDFCVYLGDDVPKKILSHLLPPIPQGFDFDAFTTDVLLHRMKASDGRIVLPDGVSYAMMLLPPDETLTGAARLKVDSLLAAGIKVWDPHGRQSLDDALYEAGLEPDVSARSARRLYTVHRQTPDAEIYFLNNHSDDVVTDQFVFRAPSACAELWHPVTGQRYRLDAISSEGRTSINLTMAPRESFFVILRNEATKGKLPAWHDRPSMNEVTRVEGDWQVQFDASAGGPAEPVMFSQLTDWTLNPDSRIKYYSGTAVYRNPLTLDAKAGDARYSLAIDEPGSVAEVVVNGHEAGTIWCSPWMLDVTPYVKRGKNKLEIRVANSLWNRLVGDANRTESERIMQQTTPLAKPTDSLVPSGLTGSVRLLKVNR